jgi:molybdate transport system permease protein
VRLRGRGGISPLTLLGGLLLAYLFVPVVAFVARFGEQVGQAAQQTSQPGKLVSAVGVSLETASIATGVTALLGIPLAYLLARGRGRLRNVVGVLVQLPLALPPLISGILLIYIVGPNTLLGGLFGGALTDDRVGIVLAQTFVASPFLIVSARSAFAAVEPAFDDVAATLGHTRMSRFLRVWLPVAAPGIGAGLLLTWLRAFGEFGATVILAYHPYSLPVYTYVQFGAAGLVVIVLPVAAALAAAFAVLALAGLVPQVRRLRPRASRLPAPEPPVPGEPGSPLRFDLATRVGSFDLRLAGRPAGRRLALLGPSGAGKTVTLRALAGLTAAGTAQVAMGADELSALAPEARGIGYLPQDPALLPHLPVWRQVTFGIGAERALGAYWLSRLGITDLAERKPAELSGGQRKRVALARALSRAPRLLLLDEPSTGLDAPVRDELRAELRRLQRDTGLTTVVVTHDPAEAALLADDVLIVSGGRVLQAGAQPEVFARPAGPQAARLLGFANLAEGRIAAPGLLRAGELCIPVRHREIPDGARVTWSIQPEHVELSTAGDYPAEVADRIVLPGHDELTLVLAGGLELSARTTPHPDLLPGSTCRVSLPAEAVTVWPREQVTRRSPALP